MTLDVVMMVADLSFSMVLSHQVADLLTQYLWFTSLDTSWYKRRLPERPPAVRSPHSPRLVTTGTASSTVTSASARRTAPRAVGSPQRGDSPPPPELKKESAHVERIIRSVKVSGGKATNYFALEYIRSHPIEVTLGGRRYTVCTKRAASVYATELYQELRSLQREIEERDRRTCDVTDSSRREEVERGQLPPPSRVIVSAVGERCQGRELRLSPVVFRTLLGGERGGEFFKHTNVSSTGKISSKEMVRALERFFLERASLLDIREAREGITMVFKLIVSIVLWLLAALAVLIVGGVDVQTLLISGATGLASFTIILGVLYTNFFKAAIFILLHDTFRSNDRVRINNGPILIVDRIRTYTTQFKTLYGRPIIYPNAFLADASIENDSRSTYSEYSISFEIDSATPRAKSETLHAACRRYVNSRPKEFTRGGFFPLLTSIQPQGTKRVSYWITMIESWHNWKSVWTTATDFMEFVLEMCANLGIEYRLPVQPVNLHDSGRTTQPHNNNIEGEMMLGGPRVQRVNRLLSLDTPTHVG